MTTTKIFNFDKNITLTLEFWKYGNELKYYNSQILYVIIQGPQVSIL